jgi:hypothetical protein
MTSILQKYASNKTGNDAWLNPLRSHKGLRNIVFEKYFRLNMHDYLLKSANNGITSYAIQ